MRGFFLTIFLYFLFDYKNFPYKLGTFKFGFSHVSKSSHFAPVGVGLVTTKTEQSTNWKLFRVNHTVIFIRSMTIVFHNPYT